MLSRLLPVGLLILSVSCVGRQSVSMSGKKSLEDISVRYSDASGDSPEEAIVITGVEKQSQGLLAEYDYISRKYGLKSRDWQVVGQNIVKEKSKVFDVIEIVLKATGEHRIYYFDVTHFPWKRK